MGEKGIWAKHTLWERACRTPLIISRPEDRNSKRTNKPANHIDLYPTLLDLAKLPPNKKNEGKSLVPLLDDPDSKGYEASLTTFGFGNHSIRTERWRYIRYEDGSEELYDHWVDQNEWNNLADAVQYKNVKNQLRNFLPETNAPSDPHSRQGMDYNPYLLDLYERTRVK
jgi:iduronate 2-sulfatase